MELVKYEQLRVALYEAKKDEAKVILDKVAALQAYAKQADDLELESWITEIKLRARRRIGEISKSLEKAENDRGNQHTDGKFPAVGSSQKTKFGHLATEGGEKCGLISNIRVRYE